MRTTLIVAALFLAACETQVAEAPAPPEDACGAMALQHLVGAPASEAEGVSAPGDVRMINPGEAVTMDFVADRLNFEMDADGQIDRVYCG
ncbi:MAG: hypothetical protein JJU15_04635 [Pararhodobacter sp.]|nr:hypothetical protein [Pararhodobacter sp.]